MRKEVPRLVCEQCQLPAKTCVCAAVNSSPASLQPIILQHPTETTHSKNTARLIDLVISNSTTYVGERPSDFVEAEKLLQSQRWLLLYPTSIKDIPKITITDCAKCHNAFTESCSARLQYKEQLSQFDGVVIIDASWRKAKKMYYQNQWLQQLTHCELNLSQPSQYIIRQHRSHQSLSTIEALMVLYKIIGLPNYQYLSQAFEFFKQRKLALMPSHVRQRYLGSMP